MLGKIVAVVFAAVALTACDGDEKTICGVRYEPYGFLNKDDEFNPDIKYRVPLSHILLGSVFFQSVIAPVYFFGFDLWVPVGSKSGTCPTASFTAPTRRPQSLPDMESGK